MGDLDEDKREAGGGSARPDDNNEVLTRETESFDQREAQIEVGAYEDAEVEAEIAAEAEMALSYLESIYTAWCNATDTDSVLISDQYQDVPPGNALSGTHTISGDQIIKSAFKINHRKRISRRVGRESTLGERAFFMALGDFIKVRMSFCLSHSRKS